MKRGRTLEYIGDGIETIGDDHCTAFFFSFNLVRHVHITEKCTFYRRV